MLKTTVIAVSSCEDTVLRFVVESTKLLLIKKEGLFPLMFFFMILYKMIPYILEGKMLAPSQRPASFN